MPYTFPQILFVIVTTAGIALAIKVTLRYRADRRHHARCVFCDGRDGAHEYCCQRPGARV